MKRHTCSDLLLGLDHHPPGEASCDCAHPKHCLWQCQRSLCWLEAPRFQYAASLLAAKGMNCFSTSFPSHSSHSSKGYSAEDFTPAYRCINRMKESQWLGRECKRDPGERLTRPATGCEWEVWVECGELSTSSALGDGLGTVRWMVGLFRVGRLIAAPLGFCSVS